MAGAINGHVAATGHPYREFVDLTPLPVGEQELFRAWFEELLANRSAPLSSEEYQLAYTAAREAWRACWWSCAEARAAEVRREMDESAQTLDVARIEVAGGRTNEPAETGGRRA